MPNRAPSSPERPTAGLSVAGRAGDVGVDLAQQDHLRDLHGLFVGDAHALDEAHLEAEPLHVAGDVGTAAVDDDGVEPDVLEQDDVGGELVAQAPSSCTAAPPYLMTTVRPWNCRMYGSASRSVSTLAVPVTCGTRR